MTNTEQQTPDEDAAAVEAAKEAERLEVGTTGAPPTGNWEPNTPPPVVPPTGNWEPNTPPPLVPPTGNWEPNTPPPVVVPPTGNWEPNTPPATVTPDGNWEPNVPPVQGGFAPGSGPAAPSFGAWIYGRTITHLFSSSERPGVWVWVAAVGWRRLAASENGRSPLTTLALLARANGLTVSYHEDAAGQIDQLLV